MKPSKPVGMQISSTEEDEMTGTELFLVMILAFICIWAFFGNPDE